MSNHQQNKSASRRKLWSFAACLLAVLLVTGGHWFALQSVAWVRMFANFVQHESLGAALQKTFDGQHPCGLCLEIRHAQQREQQQKEKLPWLKPDKLPDFFCAARPVTVPRAPENFVVLPNFTTDPPADFIQSPPKPPPRLLAVAL